MCICTKRHTKSSSKAKIGEFQIVIFVDKKVLGFEIAVENTVGMTVVEARS